MAERRSLAGDFSMHVLRSTCIWEVWYLVLGSADVRRQKPTDWRYCSLSTHSALLLPLRIHRFPLTLYLLAWIQLFLGPPASRFVVCVSQYMICFGSLPSARRARNILILAVWIWSITTLVGLNWVKESYHKDMNTDRQTDRQIDR